MVLPQLLKINTLVLLRLTDKSFSLQLQGLLTHYVSHGIFAHWFSLDQMFKFSVSFGTEVEKTDHRMDV